MFNPTQLTGLAVTALAMLACWFARQTSPWRWIAAFQALFFLEILLGMRHRLHDIMNAALKMSGLYQGRASGQTAMLAVIALLGIGLFVLARRAPRTMARIGILASSAMVLLFLIEGISLHAMDALLYRRAGPLMLIAWIWAALCGTTACAALLDKPRRRSAGRRR
jgi:hypothetical protein